MDAEQFSSPVPAGECTVRRSASSERASGGRRERSGRTDEMSLRDAISPGRAWERVEPGPVVPELFARACKPILRLLGTAVVGLWLTEVSSAGTADRPRTDDSSMTIADVRAAWDARRRHSEGVILTWREARNVTMHREENAPRMDGSPGRPALHYGWILGDKVHVQRFVPRDSAVPFRSINQRRPHGAFSVLRETGFESDGHVELQWARRDWWIDGTTQTDSVTAKDGRRLFATISDRYESVDRGDGGMEQAAVRAILVALRPDLLLPADFAAGEMVSAARPVRIGGRECWRFSVNDVRGDAAREFWFDPDRDFSVQRFIARTDAQFVEQIDVDYAQRADGSWAPKGWTIVCSAAAELVDHFGGRSELVTCLRARVVECDMGASVPADFVQASWPPRSVVHDERTRKWHTISADGATAAMSTAEGLRLILETEALAAPTRRLFAMGTAVVLAGVVVIASLRYVRRRKRS